MKNFLMKLGLAGIIFGSLVISSCSKCYIGGIYPLNLCLSEEEKQEIKEKITKERELLVRMYPCKTDLKEYEREIFPLFICELSR